MEISALSWRQNPAVEAKRRHLSDSDTLFLDLGPQVEHSQQILSLFLLAANARQHVTSSFHYLILP
jgi:hypothetical protein